MSIRKISSLASVFVVTLCLTGCLNPTTQEPKETELGWRSAKNRIDSNKTINAEDVNEEELAELLKDED